MEPIEIISCVLLIGAVAALIVSVGLPYLVKSGIFSKKRSKKDETEVTEDAPEENQTPQ